MHRIGELATTRTSAVLIGLAGLALFAFWKPFYGHPLAIPVGWVHIHAAAMLAWLLLLPVQVYLVATGNLSAHRRSGRTLWVLAPVIVLSAVALAQQRLRTAEGHIEDFRYALFWLQLYSTALFAFCVAQALRHRKDRAQHARYMLGSAIVTLDPILARVWAHWITGLPFPGDYLSHALTAALMAGLIWRERHAARGRRVFPLLLALLALGQIGYYTIDRFPTWRNLVVALAGGD